MQKDLPPDIAALFVPGIIGVGPKAGEPFLLLFGQDLTQRLKREMSEADPAARCQVCGAQTATPEGGNLIYDHQISSSLNVLGWDFAILRHCRKHSAIQGAYVRMLKRFMRTEGLSE